MLGRIWKGMVGMCSLGSFRVLIFEVAQEFALSFDGCRVKVGDVQLEVTEGS
jgi:integral membrane sensor domain MASE1